MPPSTSLDPVTRLLEQLPGLAVILTVAPVLFAAWCLATRLSRPSRLDLLLITSLFTMVSVDLLVIVLGSLGAFRLPALVATELAVAAAVWIVWRATRRRPETGPQVGEQASRLRPSGWAEWVMLVGILGLILVYVAGVLLAPPGQWDSLGYHLPIPAHFVTTGTLDVPRTSSINYYFPLNHELWLAWLMLPLHTDLLARFVGLPEWGVLFLALMGLARELGATRVMAGALAALGSMSLLHEGVASTGNDVAMAATFALALYVLLGLRASPTIGRGILAALAYGLFLGVKYPSLVYQVALLLVAAFVAVGLMRRYRPFATERARLRALFLTILLCVVVLVSGGFFYLRNMMITGNPVWPLNLRIGAVTLFEGPMERAQDVMPHEAQFHDTYSYRSIFLSSIYFRSLGPQFYLLLLCALAAPILLLVRRPRDHIDVLIVLLPLLLFALFKYGLTRQPPRFMGPVTVGATLTCAWVLLRDRRGRRLAPWLGVALVAYYALDLRHATVPALTWQWAREALLPCLAPLGLGVVALGLVMRGGRVRHRVLLAVPAILALAIGLNAGLSLAGDLYAQHRYEQWRSYLDNDMGKGWEWLARETENRPGTIAFAGTMVPPYPLCGTHLDNPVLFVPRGAQTSAAVLSLSQPFGSPDANPSYDDWLRNLRYWGARYLYVYVLYDEQRWPYEGHWAFEHSETFELAFESQRTRVYRIRP